jgi:hypothetical protein
MNEFGASCGGHTHGMYYTPADAAAHAAMHSGIPPGTPSSSSSSSQNTKRLVYVCCDSRDRDHAKFPTPTELVVQLPETLFTVSCARLLSAELTSSFYVFSAARGNTSMDVVRNGVTKTVTIPDGNYSFSTMTAAVKRALDDAAFGGVSWTVDIDAITGKTALSTSAPADVIGVDTRSLASTAGSQWGLAYYLGFDRDLLASATGVLTSPRLANVAPENYLLLECDELSNVMEATADGVGGAASRRTFAKIPINATTYSSVFFDKAITANTMEPPIAKLTSLRFRWRYHDGTPVLWNGVDWSVTIEIECENVRSNQ